MEVILSQLVQLEPMNIGWTTVRKSFNSNIIPHKGDFITDTVWKSDEEQIVKSVEINYQENCCYVYIDPVMLHTDDKSRLKEYVEMARLHGWESSINLDHY